jgi:hypothetical protein
MIAVVVVAGVLALPPGLRELAAALATGCVTWLVSSRLLSGGRERAAGACFWTLAISANVLFVALCVVPFGLVQMLLLPAWLFFLFPAVGGFGSVWASTRSRGVAGDWRREWGAWAWVISLMLLPAVTVLTVWPLRLVFLATAPALGRLAERVAAGQAVTYPVTVGPFRIAASAVDTASGNVGLMIDPDPNGPTAFVRGKGRPGGGPFRCYRPVRGDVLDIRLGNGWCYHVED